MAHEEYKELLALEALGALREDESRRLAAHLDTCAECRDELEGLQGTAAALAYTVAPVEPRAELRARVLAAVRESTGLSTQAEDSRAADEDEAHKHEYDDARGDGHQAPFSTAPGASTPPFADLSAWQLVASRPSLMYGALAAAALVAVLGVASLMLWRQNREMRGELANLSERFETWRGEMAREREARELLSAPGARIAHLEGTAVAPRAQASLVYDEKSGRALLFASQLPPTPEGKAYQLWYIAGGKPLPGGVFTTDYEGRVALRDKAPAEIGSASVFAVTLEPTGGVQSPTGEKYLLGSRAS
ncbi:MAG TPA: anti-sigma factor [Pyrinomonadaceae bacterium]|jgi:anti-sigma-K factor RskA|nr:anti-sigma factor [Pyrinomonadaceae bacterium]